MAKKKVVTATLCFLHRKTLGFGELALYHGSILTQLTQMKLIQRLNLNLNEGGQPCPSLYAANHCSSRSQSDQLPFLLQTVLESDLAIKET